MKKINKQLINSYNLFLFLSILDLKTQITYLNIVYNTTYQTVILSNKLLNFPSFLNLYLF